MLEQGGVNGRGKHLCSFSEQTCEQTIVLSFPAQTNTQENKSLNGLVEPFCFLNWCMGKKNKIDVDLKKSVLFSSVVTTVGK